MKKRLISLIMAFMLLINISACGGREKKNEAAEADYSMANAPSYDEIDLLKTLDIKNPSMKFGMDSKDQLYLSELKEKETSGIIADSNGNRLKELENMDKVSFLITLDSKDNRYILNQKYSSENQEDKNREITYSLNIYDTNGTKQKSLDLGKRKYTNQQAGITDIAVDSKGNIYLLTKREKIEVMSPDGKKIKDIDGKKADYIETDQAGNFYVGSFDGLNGHSSIEKRTLENEESIWIKELNAGHFMTDFKFSPADKTLYLITEKGILSCSADGKLQGYIFDLSRSSLIEARTFISDFAIDSKNNFYILAFKSDLTSETAERKSFLYKYTRGKQQAEAADKKTVTVAIRYSDRYIQAAVSGFQKTHPDIKINLKDYSAAVVSTSPEGPTDEELKRAENAEKDFQKNVSTEIMAGQGADIIEVLGLPFQRFIEKNVLANISDLMKNDKTFDLNKYQQNIFDACKYKGNLYIMPLNFSFTGFAVNKDIITRGKISFDSSKWTWEDFISIAEKIRKAKYTDGKTEQCALPKVSDGELFAYVMGSDVGRFINFENKTSSFDSKEFIDILKTVKAIKDKKLCSPELDIGKLYGYTDPGTVGFMQCYMMMYQSVVQQQALFNGEIQLADYPSMSGVSSAKSFTPINTYAINNNSKLKAEAWEFIKYLLSDEIQVSPDMYYFPVNKEALKRRAEREIKENFMYNATKDQGRNVKPLTQADVDMINNLINGLEIMPYIDSQAQEIINGEVNGFLSGKTSAEETAKKIQSKIAIYLNE